ncbi:MAG: Gfo/Idh/MocA family oxidoreductase [Cyanobacteria bacterium SZAS-4]|nr:Gfo/Idh/MocA family oxidoreductase [Cyanobacteria bacterium SZAS-4]
MKASQKVRFAVVGLGHIAQIAVLPAFENAREKCELTAFISDDPEKIEKLSKKYGVSNSWSYSEYEEALNSKKFDAVYIALPNDMHKDFAIKAAKAGIHVLCEKPMALDADECEAMLKQAEKSGIKLMIAYRLHFEKANMTAVDMIKSGKIGDPRVFNTSFSLQVREGNIRTQSEHGGGPLMDIGIYCINASRYIFQDEPTEVLAFSAQSSDPRFAEIEESVSAVMKFPGERLAAFTCSFGAEAMGRYEVLGTKGLLTLDPAYEYADELQLKVKSGEEEQTMKLSKHDHFAPELLHFAECILEDKQPQPTGHEGLNDLRIIDAIRESIKTGRSAKIKTDPEVKKPGKDLITEKPGGEKPELINVQSGSR